MRIEWKISVCVAVAVFVFMAILYIIIPRLERDTRERISEKMDDFEGVVKRSRASVLLFSILIISDAILKLLPEILIESENLALIILAELYEAGWFPIVYIIVSSWVLKWSHNKPGKDVSSLYIYIAFILSIAFCIVAEMRQEGFMMLAILIGHLWWFDGLDMNEIENIKKEIKSQKRSAIVMLLIMGLGCICLGGCLMQVDEITRGSLLLGLIFGMLSAIILIIFDPFKRLNKVQMPEGEGTKMEK